MLFNVIVSGKISAKIMCPKAGFVAAKRAKPHGITQNYEPARFTYSKHFLPHNPGVGNMLGNV